MTRQQRLRRLVAECLLNADPKVATEEQWRASRERLRDFLEQQKDRITIRSGR